MLETSTERCVLKIFIDSIRGNLVCSYPENLLTDKAINEEIK